MICQEAAEEQVDTSAWLRGLDQFPMTAAQLESVERITTDARLIWEELRRLAQSYREPAAGKATSKSNRDA